MSHACGQINFVMMLSLVIEMLLAASRWQDIQIASLHILCMAGVCLQDWLFNGSFTYQVMFATRHMFSRVLGTTCKRVTWVEPFFRLSLPGITPTFCGRTYAGCTLAGLQAPVPPGQRVLSRTWTHVGIFFLAVLLESHFNRCARKCVLGWRFFSLCRSASCGEIREGLSFSHGLAIPPQTARLKSKALLVVPDAEPCRTWHSILRMQLRIIGGHGCEMRRVSRFS